MGFTYVPPPAPIVHHVEEARSYGKPYFYECEGRIINLAAATQFYVDHMPLTSYYWPCAKVGGNSYRLAASMGSKEEAMSFLRALASRIGNGSATN